MFLFLCFYFWENENDEFIFSGEKMKGLSLVAPPKEIGEASFDSLSKVNANWISLMPYAFVPKGSAAVRFQTEPIGNKQWWGETPQGIKKCITLAKDKGIKVMLKPHLWLGWGQFTGDLDFKTAAEWLEFERSYKAYLLTFAKIAEEENVEVFCIGTEMGSHVENRGVFWHELIKDIKKVYKGKLTYAENWDCYDKVPFWRDLDYIGVDGYFPLSDKKDPTEKQLAEGWKKHLKNLNKTSSEIGKPIIFTEIGYRSNDYSTDKPWETDYTKPKNEKLQLKAYKVFFENVYKESWCAGAFIWKWFPTNYEHFHERETFSPQGKLAEKVLEEYFSK